MSASLIGNSTAFEELLTIAEKAPCPSVLHLRLFTVIKELRAQRDCEMLLRANDRRKYLKERESDDGILVKILRGREW